MRSPSRGHPGRFCRTVEFANRAAHDPILTEFDPGARLASEMGPDRLAIFGHKCIEIDEMRDALGNMRERAGDNEATVGKADQDDVVEVLVQHVIDHVADMCTEAHQW